MAAGARSGRLQSRPHKNKDCLTSIRRDRRRAVFLFLLWAKKTTTGPRQAVLSCTLSVCSSRWAWCPCVTGSTVPGLRIVCSWAATRRACAAASCSWLAASSFKSCFRDNRSCAMTFSWLANSLCEICPGAAALEMGGDFQVQAAPTLIPKIRASITEIAADGPLSDDWRV